MNKTNGNKDLVYKISFAFIRLFHDNFLLWLCVDPVVMLHDLGLTEGDSVLEIGCGPGFYTIGAAKTAGSRGKVFSYDVNPYAINYTRRRLREAGIENVELENKSATDTGLPSESIDFAFVVGVPHIVDGEHSLLGEITRVVKPGGLFAYKPSRGNTGPLIHYLKQRGFHLEFKRRQFLIFHGTS